MITESEARVLAKIFNIDLRKMPLKEWKYALNVELEHKDITKGNLYLTGMIVKAHINEYPDYYRRLYKMENEAKKYWSKIK